MIASPRSPARPGKLGAVATRVSLNDYPMPSVGSDAEMPEAARQLRALVDNSHGLLITSPAYNSGCTPLLKKALDGISIVRPGAPASSLKGKMAAIGPRHLLWVARRDAVAQPYGDRLWCPFRANCDAGRHG